MLKRFSHLFGSKFRLTRERERESSSAQNSANVATSKPPNTLYIIVPIYNVAPYLVECLDSIKSQTYANLTAILIDDCSTDDSAQIATQYA